MPVPHIPGFTVRPVRPDDAPAWARQGLFTLREHQAQCEQALACLPEVKAFTSSTAASVDDVLAVIQRTLAGEATSPIHFALVPQGADALVATVGFHTISALNGTAEITYDVAPEHWGRGIATAACRAATRWGFEARGWHRVQATTVLPHLGSQRVLQRCGFRREGLLRNFRLVRGVPTDYWLYAAIPGDVPAGGA